MLHPVDQRREALEIDAVMRLPSLRAVADEARELQRREMFRHRGLRDLRELGQRADVPLAGACEVLEDRPPGRIAESLEEEIGCVVHKYS